MHRPLTFRADVGGSLVNRNPLESIATAGAIGVFLAMWEKPISRNPPRIGSVPYRVTKDIFHHFVDVT